MSEIHLPDVTSWQGAVRLSDLGIIQAQGADAASFLHGQLSQDIQHLGASEARLAAYCSAKGRMLGSFVVLHPQAETYWLLADRDLVAGLVKRLSMFVLRAKARVTEATVQAVGLVGPAAVATLGGTASADAWSVQACAGGTLVRLPDVQAQPRWIWLGAEDAAQAVLKQLPAVPLAQWQWLEVMSGLPRVQAGTADQFVPQMINFELIGGVNFQKGCYPGQEVVARSQYRGTTKRRAFLGHARAEMKPGQEVFSETDPGQPAGLVINAAPLPGTDGAFSALLELKLAAREAGLHLGSAEGPTLTLGVLPYVVPMDTVEV